MDYTNSSMEISFPEGSRYGNAQCLNVPVTDDMALEGDETFILSMTVTAGDATVGNTVTTVTITSDDG